MKQRDLDTLRRHYPDEYADLMQKTERRTQIMDMDEWDPQNPEFQRVRKKMEGDAYLYKDTAASPTRGRTYYSYVQDYLRDSFSPNTLERNAANAKILREKKR